jgi:hypothetical protein
MAKSSRNALSARSRSVGGRPPSRQRRGGLAIEPPTADLAPGQTDDGLRILAFRATDEGWRLTAEGVGGSSYELRLVGAPLRRVDGAEVVRKEATVTVLRLAIPRATPERPRPWCVSV